MTLPSLWGGGEPEAQVDAEHPPHQMLGIDEMAQAPQETFLQAGPIPDSSMLAHLLIF